MLPGARQAELPETVVEVLSDEQVRELVGCIKPDTTLGARDLAIVLLLLDTGIRANELLTLTLDNVDFDHNEFKVVGKGNKERIVPLSNGTKRAVWRYVEHYRGASDCAEVFLSKGGTPLTYNGLKLLIARLGVRVGIDGLHPHQFRHCFAIDYLMHGGDEVSLQRIMGHTSFQTTQMYLKLSKNDVKQQHAKHSRADRMNLGKSKPVKRKV